MRCYDDVTELDFALADLPTLPPFDAAWMADPRDFTVEYAINPHMRAAGGELNEVDRAAARAEWAALREAFERLGVAVDVLPPLDGHPDLVFCANPGLPVPREVTGGVDEWVPSRMASAQRAGEVAHLAAFAEARGWRVAPLTGAAARFEGTGDGLWHPRRRLLWGGVGPRTEASAWEELAARYALPVVRLRLADPDFYHLDTCLALVAKDACLWYPPAFDAAGRALVERLVPRAIAVDEEAARRGFACNAWSPDGRRVVLQRGAEEVVRALRAADLEPVEVETSEFRKSGGSVFCMKLALPQRG
ncbi:MAG: amidinotransferase [Planctomycetes bacterium]|nr:amidinotransferase [Planctomycetota bacterium]